MRKKYFALLSFMALFQNSAHATVNLNQVIENIDISTFRNSLSPRSPESGKTLPAMGFDIPVKYDDQTFYGLTNKENTWTYSISNLKVNGSKLSACFYDYANPTQASYKSVTLLTLVKNKTGKYSVISESTNSTQCQ
ncbi:MULTISPECIES: hypothetical protein [Enterobacter cloacae complex]|uniref:hypothetical protein n=1 Tax=Enterobacter cloacae complex TaxID=354276 RepID=UPI00125336A3|nr:MULTISPECIES: hypothetical protein [Enterobacter cloacae complex]HAV1614271.1 hypothetical protein [Enterobacter hormaechei subsp. xiangfangensis]EKK5432648.1 hypothetical protein [Enterobacter hormaechei]MBI8958652.1 hypothetical protein [Enterobacter hormaechei]MBI8992328.1 hypothetical protein [Enterobacter hormaechei]MCC4520803.1 hypothetical protein [Enterobacter hormaechei]